MKNMVGRIVMLVVMVFITVACTSQLRYMKEKDTDDPTSPPDKTLVFSLRNSTILISQSATTKKTEAVNQGASKQGADQTDPTVPVDSCAKAEKEGDPLDPLKQCLSNVNAQATATSVKTAFYVATPAWGTTLKSTAVDADPSMLKSIQVDYKNPMIGIVSSAGAGATAGFGIGGPWGAVIGGLIGVAGGVIPAVVHLEKLKLPEWCEKNVCKEDIELDSARFTKLKPADKNIQLYLPVTLPYETDNSETQCWHPLPNRSSDALHAAIMASSKGEPIVPPLSGWFYRIVAVDPDPKQSKFPPVLKTDLKQLEKPVSPFQTSEEYFRITGYRETFPVSACRSIEVQITWWEMLQGNDKVKYYKYPMMVADSKYVQAVRLPQNGTVYLLPVCGGYESPTQSSSSLGDLIDAVVKQAQAIKDAQSKYEQKK
jgi:outer membrane lipoprotein SlyB